MYKLLSLKKNLKSDQKKKEEIPRDLKEIFKFIEMGLGIEKHPVIIRGLKSEKSKNLNGSLAIRYQANKKGRYPVQLNDSNKKISVSNKNLEYAFFKKSIKKDKKLGFLVRKIRIINNLVVTGMKHPYGIFGALKKHKDFCEEKLELNKFIHCKFFAELTGDYMDGILGSRSIKTKIEEDFGAIIKYYKIIRSDEKPFSIIYPGNEKREVDFHYIMTMSLKSDLKDQIKENEYREKAYPFEYVCDYILLEEKDFGITLEDFCSKKMGFEYTDKKFDFKRVYF